MPKKYKHSYPSKPQSTVHPSLAPAPHNHNRHGRPQDGHASASAAMEESRSVNEILARLRQTGLAAGSTSGPGGQATSLPLSLPIRLFPPSQHQPANALTPRARMVARARARPLPGPAAPASWSHQTQHRRMDLPPLSASQLEAAALASARRNDRLPDLNLPDKKTLVYRLLKRIALNWGDFVEEEGAGLAFIPPHLKKALLCLLVIYGPGLVSTEDLALLCFTSDHFEGATGVASITHVHAGYATNASVGHLHGYRELSDLLIGDSYVEAAKCKGPSPQQSIPDSWEDEAEDGIGLAKPRLTIIPKMRPRFSAMTHLDLAHANFASWKYLLRDLTPYMSQLTHLSLAFWPAPSRTNLSRSTILISASGSLDVRNLNWYGDTDADWAEAVTTFQLLGKDLPRLKWLDLEGCSSAGGWTDALRSQGRRQIDWSGTFRGLETLIIGQGSTPDALTELKSNSEFVEKWAAMAMIGLRNVSSVATWINSVLMPFGLPVLERYTHSHGYRLSDKDVRELWLWLEREYRVVNTARHITQTRVDSGVPRKLEILCTKRAPWTDALLRHPSRGVNVDETRDADLEMIRKIVTPEDMDDIVRLLRAV